MSRNMLGSGERLLPPALKMIEGAIESNDNALSHPTLQLMIKNPADSK